MSTNPFTEEHDLLGQSLRKFVAKEITYDTNSLEETESDLIVKKLPFAEAVDMVMQGKITDSLSVGGLLKLDRILTFNNRSYNKLDN